MASLNCSDYNVYIVFLKQEGLTLMAEQAQAQSSCRKVWFSTRYGKSLCYQLLPFVIVGQHRKNEVH